MKNKNFIYNNKRINLFKIMIDKKYLIIGAVVLLVAAGAYYYFYIRKGKSLMESYSNIGAIDNVGSLDDRYELVMAPEMAAKDINFADIVDTGDQPRMINNPNDQSQPFERLDRLQGHDTIPLTAMNTPAYNVDVANPSTYAFSVNAPRVLLKDPVWQLADPFRGDIPITHSPNVALVGKSQYGRDSLRLDGFWSDGMVDLYNKSTGRAFKNLPVKVMSQETHVG